MTAEQQISTAARWLQLAMQACVLFVATLVSHSVLANTTLTFCFQDQPLVPYYIGDGNQVNAGRPGATIEHLQLISAKVPGLTLKLVRYPWQRCLKYLQNGEVDAVVANYSESRRALGVFPMQQDQPDPDREFTKQEICLVTSKALAKKWNGHSFSGVTKVILAHQAGRSLQQLLPHRQFIKIPISAQSKALHMLAQNKVQVVSMICKIAGKSALAKGLDPETMQVLEPGIEVLHGHLMFSHQFYQAHQAIAEALWAQLTDPPIEIYLNYLNDDAPEEHR